MDIGGEDTMNNGIGGIGMANPVAAPPSELTYACLLYTSPSPRD